MLTSLDGPRRPERPLQPGLTVLRIGAGLTLLYLHVWHQSQLAFQFVWNRKAWDAVEAVKKSGLPFATVLAVGAEAVALLVALSWILGFATRFFSLLFLPVMLGSLWVANKSGETNGAELCLLYFFISIALLVHGSGWFALDTVFQGRRSKPKRR
jgi:uncharacterized membrane protein YphA (DoxX/SURF4 family)